MSGLLAARVLADHYRQVTVVERDPLTAGPTTRRGVPQSRHAHALLPRGAMVLDELFPGLLSELRQGGVPVTVGLNEVHFDLGGHLLSQEKVDRRPSYGVSRPYLESTVLRRVRALPNVTFMDEHPVLSLRGDRTGSRVTGARVACAAAFNGEVTLDADLVLAATGRGALAGAWLSELGYPAPPEQQVKVDVKYASRRVRFAPGATPGVFGVLIGPRKDRPLGLGAFAQEDDHWMVTLAGYGGHHPPDEEGAWLAFAARVAPPWFLSALIGARPLGDIYTHRFPTTLRRRFDKLEAFPEGFLVTGDALSSFNPIYGQGMTVAALEAMALRDTLRGGGHDLAKRYFHAVAKPVASAWRFAVSADLAMPADVVPGPRSLPRRAANAYLAGYQAAAEHDPTLARQFLDVTGFDVPARTLLTPRAVGRIVTSQLRRDRNGARAPAALATRP